MARFMTRVAVYIMLEKDYKILMFKRKNTNWYDGYFNVPCGHINGGESVKYAAAREVFEEVGVTVAPQDLEFVHMVHRFNGTYEYIEAYFKAKKWKGTPRIAEEEYGEELTWFDLQKLPPNTVPYIKEAIEMVQSGKTYSEYSWKDGKPLDSKPSEARVSIICAVAEKDRAIGKDNHLLWDIPADLRHFQGLTAGHPIIMGEKTFYSIGRPLPNRTNIVISLNKDLKIDGCLVFNSIPEAIEAAKKIDKKEVFVIGGGSIYKQTIDIADRLYLTLVQGQYDADVFFPDFSQFRMIREESAESAGFKYRYTVWEK